MTNIRLIALAVTALGVAGVSGAAFAQSPALTKKLNAYIGCINRLSERSYSARERYFSWAAKTGPTGKERIIYGTYTIYDTADCKKNVEAANALEPRDADLEAAATAYVAAVTALEPLLKETDDYYTQQNYKDDKMATGKALHPRLVAAWTAFATADSKLRAGVEGYQDKQAVAKLGEIEQSEGRKARYHVEALMIRAKGLFKAQQTTPADLARITAALTEYEGLLKSTEDYAGQAKDANGNERKIGSGFIGSAKSFLVTAKHLMRRVRDKVAYSSGEKMIMSSGGGAWMVEGSPARLTRDYNQLVESYNRGGNF